jgi:hypothetical protein
MTTLDNDKRHIAAGDAKWAMLNYAAVYELEVKA